MSTVSVEIDAQAGEITYTCGKCRVGKTVVRSNFKDELAWWLLMPTSCPVPGCGSSWKPKAFPDQIHVQFG